TEPTLFDQNPVQDKQHDHLKDVKYIGVTDEAALKDLAKQLEAAQAFAFDTETTSVDDMTAELVGISVSLKPKTGYYIPIGHQEGKQLALETVVRELKAAFENPKIDKVGHNAKYDYKILRRHGIRPTPIAFDTMIAAFLLNPLGRSQSLDDLAYREFGIEMISI